MRAFEAVRAGARDLARAPSATAAAVVAALAASLGLRTALARARFDVAAAFDGRAAPGDALAHAGATLLLGLLGTSLLVEAARAVALCAYAGPRGAPVFWLGMRRVAAMISVGAVEATVYLSLAYGVAAVCARAGVLGTTPAARAAVASLACAPALALAAPLWLSARVAIVLTARGVEAAPALVHGFDLTLRRLPSLARLGAAWVAATLPLGLAAAALVWAAPGAAALQLTHAVFLQLAILLGYAALGSVVGRDARLSTG
jgi:hypothetical protein